MIQRVTGLLLPVCFAISLGVSAPQATTEVAVNPQHLRIILPEPANSNDSSACTTIGQLLAGAEGHAIFDTFACGTAPSDTPSSTIEWTLRINQRKSRIVTASVEIHGTSPKSGRSVVASSTFDPSEESLGRLLADREFSEVLVWTLLDQMPFIIKIRPEGMAATSAIPVRHRKNRYVELPEPASTIYLFTLKVEPKTNLWRSELLGKGRLSPPSSRSKRRTELAWETDLGGKAAPVDQPLFAHATDETRMASNDYRTLLENAIRTRSELLIKRNPEAGFLKSVAPGRSAYVQTAMGMARVDPDAVLLPKTRRVLGQGQFRAGRLTGISGEVDVLPKEREDFDGKSYQIAWHRIAVGRAFAFHPTSLPSWLLDRIDFTPRLGMWQMDAVLPARDSEDRIVAVDYGFNAQFDAGFNLGLEVTWPWGVAARFWHARDITSGFIVAKGAPGAASSRFGGDLFVAGPKLPKGLSPANLYLTVFYFTETATFSPEQKQELSLLNPGGAQDSDALREVYYTVDYVGAGIGTAF